MENLPFPPCDSETFVRKEGDCPRLSCSGMLSLSANRFTNTAVLGMLCLCVSFLPHHSFLHPSFSCHSCSPALPLTPVPLIPACLHPLLFSSTPLLPAHSQLAALLPAQQQLLLQQAQAQLLAAAVQQSNAAHAAHAAQAAAQQQANQQQNQTQSQPQQQSQQTKQEQAVQAAPPQLALSQPIQLTAQVRPAGMKHVFNLTVH